METLSVKDVDIYTPSKIKASFTGTGGVNIWFEYDTPEIKDQRRHEVDYTPEEWDRLVAWVEWQRKDAKITKPPIS